MSDFINPLLDLTPLILPIALGWIAGFIHHKIKTENNLKKKEFILGIRDIYEWRGFSWAMAAYFYEGKSLDEIESYCGFASIDRSYTSFSFDSGAREAVNQIKRIKAYLVLFSNKPLRDL